MLKLVLFYVLGVVVKWGWEFGDWTGEHKGSGFKAWIADQKSELIKKGFMHVFLCPGWLTGIMMNAMVAAVSAIAMAVPGESSGPPISLPINAATTIMAAYMFDSMGKPIMKRLKKKEADG
jgi:hypothetical protein